MRNSSSKILATALAICALGVLSIYSTVYQKEAVLWQSVAWRQIAWIALGLAAYLVFSNFNYRRFWDLGTFLYFLAVLLLLLVFGLGIVRLGAQRWLRLAWFNLQPSEVAKLALLVFLAKYFSRKSVRDIALSSRSYGIWRSIAVPFLFISFPVALIIEQPDLGSGVMMICLFVAFLYLAGVKLRYILIFIFILALPLPLFWHFLRDYQRQRLLVFINPNIDPLGAGYTIIQSKIAIGSSGLIGKGWLSGTQSQLRFLPESHTDFIFATFCEEWGILGGLILLSLYYLLIRQGFIIAQRTGDAFGKFLAYGISLMLCVQVAINIAMNMGLAPVVGIPLPLMSYGGSCLVTTFVALGILVNIDRTRAVF